LINSTAVARIKKLVSSSLEQGAQIFEIGFDKATTKFFNDNSKVFCPPTILTSISPNMPIFAQEIFGPVVPVITFQKEEEAIQLANQTEYGLAAYLFTENLSRAFRVSEDVQAGMVAINHHQIANNFIPFGGIKHSGMGRECGKYGINEFCTQKVVNLNVD